MVWFGLVWFGGLKVWGGGGEVPLSLKKQWVQIPRAQIQTTQGAPDFPAFS